MLHLQHCSLGKNCSMIEVDWIHRGFCLIWFGFVELGGCRLGFGTNELREGWNREGRKKKKTFSLFSPGFNLFMDALLPLVTSPKGGGSGSASIFHIYNECCARYEIDAGKTVPWDASGVAQCGIVYKGYTSIHVDVPILWHCRGFFFSPQSLWHCSTAYGFINEIFFLAATQLQCLGEREAGGGSE